MKNITLKIAALIVCFIAVVPAQAQFNVKRGLKALKQGVEALTLTDEQMAAYVKESVDWMDKNNPVLPEDNPYTQRLCRLTEGITEADGIPLNFKVYHVTDVNAFACPDGSVRVFSALMDLMDDDELMGVIGHEIGHVLKHHSKNAFKNQLLTGACKDAIAASNTKVAALTDSQLGALSESLLNAKYSQKQELEADDCGYDFLVQKGRNPIGMARSFEKLLSLEQQSGSQPSAVARMFSSHPDTQARIKHITERAISDGYVSE